VAVRVWGELDDRLVEVVPRPGAPGTGLRIEGLPAGRGRTMADRVRAALINAGVVDEAPSAVVRLDPELEGGRTCQLDLAVAIGALVAGGLVGTGLRWILAAGRLGPDGLVEGPDGPVALGDMVAGLCHTPLLASEHMFEKDRP
jgi:predicted ATPase with chaperone activity